MTLFYNSLVVSALMVAAILPIICYIRNGRMQACCIAIVSIIAILLSHGSLAVIAQAAVLGSVAIGASQGKWSFRTLAIATFFSSAAVYLAISALAIYEVQRYADLRERYAGDLLSERLPTPKHTGRAVMLKESSKEQLAAVEQRIRDTRDDWDREMALINLHQRRMETFVNSSGFGVRRIISRPTDDIVKPPEMAEPLPQPGTIDDIEWSANSINEVPPRISETGLNKLHVGGIVDFVNPKGFGYVTSEKRLFSFQPHHFRAVPVSDDWQVRTLELVGLVVHEQPRVYVTKNLPRMEEIRAIPTRSLDVFESTGLVKLQAGDDLFIRAATRGIRMLGAVRAIERCTECHGGERGDLLGAFSYSLTRTTEK